MPRSAASAPTRILLAWPPDAQRQTIAAMFGDAGHEVTLYEPGGDAPYPLRGLEAATVADVLIVRVSQPPRLAFAILAHSHRVHPRLRVIAVVDERRSWIGSEVEHLGADRIIEARWAHSELPTAVDPSAWPHRHELPVHAPTPATSPRLRIALAEDDLEMRRFIAASLRRDGYEVLEFRTAAELLDALVDQLERPLAVPRVDLIISDLRMPGLTGLELRWRLRGPDRDTPFILITAFGGVEVRSEAAAIGAAAVIDKPFEMAHLRATVSELLGSAPP